MLFIRIDVCLAVLLAIGILVTLYQIVLANGSPLPPLPLTRSQKTRQEREERRLEIKMKI